MEVSEKNGKGKKSGIKFGRYNTDHITDALATVLHEVK